MATLARRPTELGFATRKLEPPPAAPRGRGWADQLPRRNAALTRLALTAVVASVDLLVAVATAVAAEALYHALLYTGTGVTAPNLFLCLLAATLFVGANLLRGDYRPADYVGLRGQTWRQLAVWSVSFLVALAVTYLGKEGGETSRAGVALFYVAGFIAIFATRRRLFKLAQDMTAPGGVAARRIFLVGFEENINEFLSRQAHGATIVGAIGIRDDARTLDDDLALAAASARVLRPDDVFILTPWSRTQVVDDCVNAFLRVPAQIHLGPERVLDRFVDARIDKIGALSSLSLGGHPLNPLEIVLKRCFDATAATLALLLLSPLLLFVAALIKLDSPGPALFTQRRYGFNREAFRIFKFRSMTTMDDGAHIEQAKANDRRVTRVGRVIRRFNIDELPQLINVLRGEMSLVGPRPHAVAHDQLFERKIALYARRHNVRPGITGWAQVNGLRGEIDSPEKIRARVEHDLYYIDNWSLPLDLWIIALTIFSNKAYRNAV
ncbi:MAG TPA: exopolysaccharide biosynthesis polyprenyl glycosylphosphotransferase [Methylocystis sp.]|nr:exopolysaccharide biosynthesis polyprenyl glycosylphosphotransferase [Methylocystis sp.]